VRPAWGRKVRSEHHAWIAGAIAGYLAGFLVKGEGLGVIETHRPRHRRRARRRVPGERPVQQPAIDGPFDISSIVVATIGAIITVVVAALVTATRGRSRLDLTAAHPGPRSADPATNAHPDPG
jgi:uncharacterized membrane protein YeaQ/YmgE (transglycosylase-associated protein family)